MVVVAPPLTRWFQNASPRRRLLIPPESSGIRHLPMVRARSGFSGPKASDVDRYGSIAGQAGSSGFALRWMKS
jgi:hypothetical protein